MLTESRPSTILQRPNDASGTAGRSILDELLTAKQIAAMLHLRVSTVEEYARRGLLPSVKLGRHRRFLRSEVEEALLALVRRSEADYSVRRPSQERLDNSCNRSANPKACQA